MMHPKMFARVSVQKFANTPYASEAMTIHIWYDVFGTCCDERPRVCATRFSGCGHHMDLGFSSWENPNMVSLGG